MANEKKISLRSAIFININIMLGSGIFINTNILAQQTGILAPLCYVLVGILMLPLILAMSELVAMHPSGGFYTFAKQEINPYAGFISTWSYITGKLASAVIVTHVAVTLMQRIIPFLNNYNALALDASIIIFFICLNMLDVKTSSIIQSGFLGLKLIPIFFGIIGGLYLFSCNTLTQLPPAWSGIPVTLPLILFAIAGFEAACSLSSQIVNAKKNAPRAIFISYFFTIAATTIFQFLISGALGNFLKTTNYLDIFPAMLTNITSSSSLQINTTALLYIAIAASALGGAYGIIFSNMWNLYTLAQNNHLIGSSYFITMNRFNIPWLCVLFEGTLCLSYLGVSQGSQIPLQQLGALGPSIAYTFSALSLIYAARNRPSKTFQLFPYLALGSCLLMILATIYGLMIYGAYSLLAFGTLSILGSGMFWMQEKRKTLSS